MPRTLTFCFEVSQRVGLTLQRGGEADRQVSGEGGEGGPHLQTAPAWGGQHHLHNTTQFSILKKLFLLLPLFVVEIFPITYY
jgi:hypothetical protein